MNAQLSSVIVVLSISFAGASYAQTNFLSGATFGPTGSGISIVPFAPGTSNSLELSAYDGGLFLYSSVEGLQRGTSDGGITLYGNPVDIALSSDGAADYDRGVFNVWSGDKYLSGNPAHKPLFSVASPDMTAKFEGVNVSISNGTLTVASSPVLTNSTAGAFLASFTGPIDIGNGSTGNPTAVAIGQNSPYAGANAAVALGGGSATGQFSFATGEATQAIGKYSFAAGGGAQAHGWYSTAFGNSQALAGLSFAASQGGTYASATGSTAVSGGVTEGVNAFAAGNGTYAYAFNSASLGTFPVLAPGENKTAWSALDSVFTVGNGWWTADNSGRSNAIKTLKNGQTTVTNKKWSGTTPLADPDIGDSTDAGGTALIVKGHTVLEGKVTISNPQGDISMGIYD